MTDFFPRIVPITSQAQIDSLAKIAAGDGHRVLMPTHLIIKGDQVLGYASLAAIVPLMPGAQPHAVQVHVWFHTQRCHSRDSFHVINALENIARCAGGGARTLIVPCTKESPFFKQMSGMGYAPIMDTTLWGKPI